jgi:hypothetical protein
MLDDRTATGNRLQHFLDTMGRIEQPLHTRKNLAGRNLEETKEKDSTAL